MWRSPRRAARSSATRASSWWTCLLPQPLRLRTTASRPRIRPDGTPGRCRASTGRRWGWRWSPRRPGRTSRAPRGPGRAGGGSPGRRPGGVRAGAAAQLRVLSGWAFVRALTQGIGHARAYSCGLLLVR
ncbi:type I-E CRISPR-associated protein Cas6/Cse3/CasE [Kitasatospora sp. NPDC057500]|uniref:type I-E CRISPR-associated protein Cas6/Cse3/CasE n=1 Tax=Kitasatospora sp. NPDC057500 TaxID=3346151 RepID=UPI0036896E6F